MTRAGAIAVLLSLVPMQLLASPAGAPASPPIERGGNADVIPAGTMTSLTTDQTGWLRRVYFLARQAVFGVAGYDPHGSYLVRFTVAPDGRGYGFRLLGYRGRDAEYAAIVRAVSSVRFPPAPDGRPRTVVYQATP